MKTVIMTSKASLVRQLTLLSLIGFTSFLGLVTVLHVLRPDYNPISRTISEYANGSYGFLMTGGFVVLGLGSAALVLALILGVPASGRSRSGPVWLAVWSLGLLILSIFPTDLYGIPVSRHGVIHSFSALIAFISLLLAALLCSLHFRRDGQWQNVARSSLILALLLFITLVVFLASPAAFKGITERLLVLVAIGWLGLVALKLRSLSETSVVQKTNPSSRK